MKHCFKAILLLFFVTSMNGQTFQDILVHLLLKKFGLKKKTEKKKTIKFNDNNAQGLAWILNPS